MIVCLLSIKYKVYYWFKDMSKFNPVCYNRNITDLTTWVKLKKILNPFAISTYITFLMSFPCLLKKSYSVAKSWQSHNGALGRWYCYISRIVQVVPYFSPGLLYLFLVVWIVVAWRSSICLIAPLHLHQRPFLVLVLFLQVILVAMMGECQIE